MTTEYKTKDGFFSATMYHLQRLHIAKWDIRITVHYMLRGDHCGLSIVIWTEGDKA